MIPLAIVTQPEQPAGHRGTLPKGVNRKGAIGRAGEQPRMKNLDAGVDEGRHLLRLAESDPAELIHGEIAQPFIAHGAHGGLYQQESVHAGAVPDGGEPAQGFAVAAAPDDLGIDDVKGIRPQQWQGMGDAAACIENRILAGNTDRRARSAGQMALDLIAKIMRVHHGALDAHIGQAIEGVIDERLACHLD